VLRRMLLGLLAPPRKGPSTRPETLFCPLWLWRAKAKHWRIVASLRLQYRLHELHLTLRWPMFGQSCPATFKMPVLLKYLEREAEQPNKDG
jgi:hypothetical protein